MAFFARLYASTYPDEVVGLVLVDAYSERLETLMTARAVGGPGAAQPRVRHGRGRPDSGLRRRRDDGLGRGQRRRARGGGGLAAAADALAVLAHGKPFAVPADAQGFTTGELEAFLLAANEDLATLVPNARFSVASESGHDIHQDQPELVIEAIRQVVAGVRNPDTWYDLTSCCAE